MPPHHRKVKELYLDGILVILALHTWVTFSIISLIFTETVALLWTIKVMEN